MKWQMEDIFQLVVQRNASDVIFVSGAPPTIWVAGLMEPLDASPVTSADVKDLFFDMLTDSQRSYVEKNGDVDFSVGKAGVGRFRINLHRQRDTWSAAMRFVPFGVPSFDRLKLPERILQLADLPHGLILVTGETAAGKSTTLAAMIDYMNRAYAYHIITLEDPIEFAFQHGRCIIEQREIGTDCPTFASALRHVVRQRPDVIMLGEMRDRETIAAALTAAETGNLVLASLHTSSAVETINRIVDVFPASQQPQIRVQLSDTLRGVVCQSLFHDEIDHTMVPAAEIMIATPAVRRAIRERETHLLAGMIETGRKVGMQSMDSAIAALVAEGRIPAGIALSRAHNPDKVARLIA